MLESVRIIRSIDNEEVLIELRSDNIVKVLFKENMVLDIPMQEKLYELYHEICKGKKYGFIFDAMDNVTITKEARENAIKLEKKSSSYASAAIANTLPYRLIANFYLKFNKPAIPFRLFRKEEEALEWLAEQRKKYLEKTGKGK